MNNSYIDMEYIRNNSLDNDFLSLTDEELTYYTKLAYEYIEMYFINHKFAYPKKDYRQFSTFPRINEMKVSENVKKAQMYLANYFYINKDNLKEDKLFLSKLSAGDISKEYDTERARLSIINYYDYFLNLLTIYDVKDIKGVNLC